MFSSVLLLLAAAVSPALATVYVTAPVATTSWAAGQQQTVSWKDDGTAPSLANFGPSKVSVYVGSQTQQTMVQAIVASVDLSTTSSIVFTPDASTGQNGQYYFIRFESLSFKDPNNPAYPALAFSSKYTMTGMTGTFTADELAQISAAANSGSATATSAASAQTSAAASATSTKMTSVKASGTSSAASGSSTAKAASSGNGASTVPISALTCVAGVAVAVFSAMLM
ncbi:hypothetical protein GSI_09223 [Ganoderma sinense ZZ0214-1]|uniref:Yeast cell wall synthesis Kre9/Knh1-like N-terminal domain-containing protein n=1 Tax=Ganoderma sinense ZZ0214-1 TaxID=1077348 RepID=A0A2G8S613_9APHY|nr:hypothetical protein GSI_09223 [Ganoderma sinense ZZ0214-1]